MADTPPVDKAPRTPSTLTSLPVEVLTIVAHHVDQQTAASLVRTCRYLTPVFRDRLWRHPEIYVEHLWDLAKDSEEEVADVHRAAIQAKVSSILSQGDERKWGSVETLRVCPRPGTAHGMVYLLQCVSANLQRLHVETGDEYDDWKDTDHEPLDIFLRTAHLSFPSLTHLTLGNQTIRFAKSLALLCDASPSLVFLDVTLDHELEKGWVVPKYPKHLANTRLQELRISFGRLDPGVHDSIIAYEPIFSLLAHSPRVSTLILKSELYTDFAQEVFDGIMPIIEDYEALTDLHICASAKYFNNSDPESDEYFPTLKRVIFETTGMPSVDIFLYPPAAPQLEIAIFDGSAHCGFSTPEPSSPAFKTSASQTLPMIPKFAQQIRLSPRLRVIAYTPSDIDYMFVEDVFSALDEVEQSGGLTGSVYSYKREDEELLHVRLFLRIVETADSEAGYADPPIRWDGETAMVPYLDFEGMKRKKKFEYIPKPMWFDFTDLGGELVPLPVIEQMRLAEGATEEQWQRRGIEVGKAGWKVVEDWRAEFGIRTLGNEQDDPQVRE